MNEAAARGRRVPGRFFPDPGRGREAVNVGRRPVAVVLSAARPDLVYALHGLGEARQRVR